MMFGEDYHTLPFYDCCCGSGEVAHYIGKPAHMVDIGPWGHFWQALTRTTKTAVLEKANEIGAAWYESWVRTIAVQRIPINDAEFVIVFLALQREAFNGKPIQFDGRQWKLPGFGRTFSWKQWLISVNRALEVRINSVLVTDVNTLQIERPANVYLDPDYEDTVGYHGRTVDVTSFVRRHPHCNIVVSHHTSLLGTVSWDAIKDISQNRNKRKNFAKDTSELLHIKKREVK